MDPLTLLISLLLGGEIVAALVATAYIVRRHSQLIDKAPFLTMLVNRNVRVALGGAVIGAVILYSLVRYALPELHLSPLLPPLGALLIGIPLALMLFGPISDGYVWWRESRRGDDQSPGTFK